MAQAVNQEEIIPLILQFGGQVKPRYLTRRTKNYKFILASLLHRKSYAKLDDCSEIEFMDNDLNTLYEYIKNGTKDKPALVSGVFDRIDVQENPLVLEIINFSFGEENNDEIIWKDCLIKNEQRKLDRQKDILEKEWKKSDLKERIEIGRKMQEIDKRRFMLKSKKQCCFKASL